MAFRDCIFTELEVSAKIHQSGVDFESICHNLVQATKIKILVFAARYASVCLYVYLLALSIMKFVCILADAHVCAHIHDVYSHACVKHSPAKYMCIYIHMGKTRIFSIEIA